MNVGCGRTAANAVLATVSAFGSVCFRANATTDLVVDVQGWFGAGSPYHSLTPERLVDTR